MQSLISTLQSSTNNHHFSITLADGLKLRNAFPQDAEPLAQFNGAWLGTDPVDERMVAAWTRDFVSDAHPTCGASNVFIVEDTREKKIVSTLCLIPQTWTYAGIPFAVGRPEAVATHPDYRQRGLVRKLFEVLHAQSAAQGHLAQGITGIHWFYRQFGYEYALELSGGRVVDLASIDALAKNEAYRLREMALDDIPFAARLYDRDCARALVACPRSDALWQHILAGYARDSAEARPHYLIEREGRAVGYLAINREMGGGLFRVVEFCVNEGENLRACALALLPALKAIALKEAAQQNKTVNAVFFNLGRAHPVFDAIPELLKARAPYAWYIRVPDVLRFLRQIAPALEARLARSAVAAYTGELRMTFYRDGLRWTLENGKIAHLERWRDEIPSKADAAFPPLVFLQLLFCYRSLDELCAAFPDCIVKDDAAVLLNALFPKMRSWVMAVG